MSPRAAIALGFVVLLLSGGAAVGNSTGGSGSGSSRCVAELSSFPRFVKPQLKHANTIAEAAIEVRMRHLREAVVVALATVMQESEMRNLNYGDRDSVGLFQQRSNWGTYAERMDPRTAAKKFYRALKRVRGWWNMRVTEAAQAVQISAFPEAYQAHVPLVDPLATRLLRDC